MKTEQHHFIVSSKTPPAIEVDSQAQAVYIRFKDTKVTKTIPSVSESMHVAVDLDSKGEVVGIEAIGMTQFTLRGLLQMARVKTPQMDFSRAQYSPTDCVEA